MDPRLDTLRTRSFHAEQGIVYHPEHPGGPWGGAGRRGQPGHGPARAAGYHPFRLACQAGRPAGTRNAEQRGADVRAVVITEPGGPDVLKLTEVPDPVAGPGEVLVDVVAAGVNRADVMQRQGMYPPPPGAPPYPGLECSGRVAALGEGTHGWNTGDEVCALLGGGGYAERVAVPAGQLLPVPAGVTLTDSAGLPEVACTVFVNVFQQAALRPGETLLVHGGASGIGTMAIQLAHAHGARVACTAGTPAKLGRCRELGAGLAVNYAEEDFVEAVREFTGGRGADVILDIMGAAYLQRNVAALATGGRLAVIATQGGSRAELDLGLLLRKRASVQASSLRARPPAEKAAIVAATSENVWPLISAGRVRPVIDRVLPLAEAPEAHRLMESGAHIGKILLAT
jgi:putative PIG3 family NAD(P)H quinone oxidoreductase